jgi:hypothetical protein
MESGATPTLLNLEENAMKHLKVIRISAAMK